MTNHRSLAFVFAILLIITPPVSSQNGSPLDNLQPITTASAAQLQKVAEYGNGAIRAIDWAGDVIAVGGTLGVWLHDAQNLDAPPRLLETDFSVRIVILNETGTQVAVASGGDVFIWDTQSGELIAQLEDVGGDQLTVNFEQGLVAASSYFGEVAVWSISNPGTSERRYSFDNTILELAFQPDSTLLAVETPGIVYMWRSDAEPVPIVLIPEEATNIRGLAYTPDGRKVALPSEQGVQLLDATTYEVLREIPLPLDYYGRNSISKLIFNQDASLLALIHANDLAVWDMEADRIVLPLGSLQVFYGISFSPDGMSFAFIDRFNANVVVIDPQTGVEQDRFGDYEGTVVTLNLSPNGDFATSFNGDMYFNWDLAAGRRTAATLPAVQRSALVDGDIAVTVRLKNYYPFIIGLDRNTQEEVYQVYAPFGGFRDLELSNHRIVAAYNEFGQTGIGMWDVSTGALIDTFRYQPGTDGRTIVRSLSISPDGSMCALIVDYMFSVWNLAAHELLFSSPGHWSYIAFSFNGRYIVAAEYDSLLSVWGIPSE